MTQLCLGDATLAQVQAEIADGVYRADQRDERRQADHQCAQSIGLKESTQRGNFAVVCMASHPQSEKQCESSDERESRQVHPFPP